VPKAAFNAVGCKLNQYEVQAIAEALEPHGFQQVPFESRADLYVINTCTVTSKADYTSRQMVRRALRLNPAARIIVTGCYAELDSRSVRNLGQVTLIADNAQKNAIPDLALKMFGISGDPAGRDAVDGISRMNGHSRAFIKIQEGCRDKCAYCVIWKARGKPRSRPPGKIVEEINRLHENGYREVVLTGVHIGKYRSGIDLAGLLRMILENTEMPRIRLSSLKPNEFKDALIQMLADNKRICPHAHLPVQSGDDGILGRMGRKYSALSVQKLIQRLVEARPEITVGADFIVGFPGESEPAFERSVALVEQNPIHLLHVFSYSDRPNTPASEFADKIPPETKSRRSERLRRLAAQKKLEHMRRFIGGTLDIIVEDRLRSGWYTGVSDNYLKIEFRGVEGLQKKHLAIDASDMNSRVLKGDPSSVVILRN